MTSLVSFTTLETLKNHTIFWLTFFQNTGQLLNEQIITLIQHGLIKEFKRRMWITGGTLFRAKHYNISVVFLSYKIFIFIKVINITGRPTFDCCCFAATNLCKTSLYLLLIFIARIECQTQNVIKPFLKKCKRPLNNKYKLLIQMNLPETAHQTPGHQVN